MTIHDRRTRRISLVSAGLASGEVCCLLSGSWGYRKGNHHKGDRQQQNNALKHAISFLYVTQLRFKPPCWVECPLRGLGIL